MRAGKLWVCMAVICSLSAPGCSRTDHKDYRALALEVAETAYPEEMMVSGAMQGAKMSMERYFERGPKTRQYAEVLKKTILEVSEVMIRDPETISRFRDMQVDLFMETYTETELREIMKFYRTPVGKKSIRSLPKIIQKGMERGAAIGKSLADSPKFKELLNEKINRLKAEGKLPGDI